MYIFLIIGLRSVYGTGIRTIGLFNADLAALSAFSLPDIPTWLGNQQNMILKDWVIKLWYFNGICKAIWCSRSLLAMELMLDKDWKSDNWKAKACVAWCCPAHTFPPYHRSHGTAKTTENKSKLILNCLIMLFNCIFHLYLFHLFLFFFTCLMCSPAVVDIQGASWTHWAGVPQVSSEK